MALGGKTRLCLLIGASAIVASLYFGGDAVPSEPKQEQRVEVHQTYAPVVLLKSGQVRGIIQQTEDQHSVYLYQGIRYGQAARFEKAKPVDPWEDVYNASHYREACPQLPSARLFGRIMSLLSKTDTTSEDCLYLNVWRPAEEPTDNKQQRQRAVMFWIHGGAFETGTIFTQAYDGRYLAHRGDVVLVSVNYRLGALGFLYGGGVPGNLGLHDQILALKWVRDNIAAFGGDPAQVTIFGESAGGISVGALVLSPLANGLFRRAILQSGAQSGFYTSQSLSQALQKTKGLAGKLDCPIETVDASVACLRTKPVDDILNASRDAFTTNQLFLPVYGDELMPMRPQEALKTGNFNSGLDLMFGVTKDEGTMFALALFPELRSTDTVLTMQSTKDYIVKLVAHYGAPFGEEVAAFYAAKLSSNPTQDELKAAIGTVWGDYHLVCPTVLFAEHYARLSPANSFYAYRLVTPIAVPNMTIPDWIGTFHTADLFYLFMVPITEQNVHHYRLSLDMMQTWTQFAKTGRPGKLPSAQLEWEDAFDHDRKVRVAKLMTLDSGNYRMMDGFYRETCDTFWRPKIFV